MKTIDILHDLDISAALIGVGVAAWQLYEFISPNGMKMDVRHMRNLDEVIKVAPQRAVEEAVETIQKARGLKSLIQIKKDISNNNLIPDPFKKELFKIINTRIDQIPKSQIIDHFVDTIKNSTSMLLDHFHYFV